MNVLVTGGTGRIGALGRRAVAGAVRATRTREDFLAGR